MILQIWWALVSFNFHAVCPGFESRSNLWLVFQIAKPFLWEVVWFSNVIYTRSVPLFVIHVKLSQLRLGARYNCTAIIFLDLILILTRAKEMKENQRWGEKLRFFPLRGFPRCGLFPVRVHFRSSIIPIHLKDPISYEPNTPWRNKTFDVRLVKTTAQLYLRLEK